MTDPKTLELLKDRSQKKKIEYFMSHEAFKGWEGCLSQPVLSGIYTAFGVSPMSPVHAEDRKGGRARKEMNGNDIKKDYSSLDKYITLNKNKE